MKQYLCILYLILLCTPGIYSQDNLEDFMYGRTKSCISDGTGESKGLKFKFEFPESWIESDSTSFAKRIVWNNNTYYNIIMTVYVEKYDHKLTGSEKREFMGQKAIRDDYEIFGFVIDTLILKEKIDNQNAISIIYTGTSDRFNYKTLEYLFAYKNYGVVISFLSITGGEKTPFISERDEKLFRNMAKSFVLIP